MLKLATYNASVLKLINLWLLEMVETDRGTVNYIHNYSERNYKYALQLVVVVIMIHKRDKLTQLSLSLTVYMASVVAQQ
jgi:hypothetical protein